MPFNSVSLGSEQGLIDDPVLGQGRDPLAPLQDVINDEGDIMVPMDPRYLGLWLTGFGMRDGMFSIVRDVAQSVPIQQFTPRNTMGFRGIKTFTQIPHGLKCRFVNPDRDWQQDEVIVYADGYGEANASRFETLELFGCTSADLAWKHGRYHLPSASSAPRPTRFPSISIIWSARRVDLVKVSHDVPLWGGGWGRIKDVTHDVNGDAVSVTLDDVVAMETGKIYAVRFRHADGVSSVASVVTVPGETNVLSFPTPLAVYLAPEPGDPGALR